MTIMQPGPEDAPQLDLGKKVSTPQDLMIEELSLRNNRGSRLFQQRQKRMQRFVFEHPSGYRQLPGVGGSHHTRKGGTEETANEWTAGEDGGLQNYHSEIHVAASPQGGPPEVPKKTEKVLQMSKILNPDSLAPGYSGPLKEVPPEKFNVTAIPKGYRSPWHELLGDKDNALHSKNQPPVRPSPWDFRSFNRANQLRTSHLLKIRGFVTITHFLTLAPFMHKTSLLLLVEPIERDYGKGLPPHLTGHWSVTCPLCPPWIWST
ncbi:myozenin-3 isoform B [Patagioenas fasciata monilis]|uniref:Myozenin-3 isoform B n=1 Tax=Patagioenas fasciata monilis TaxID=372326 RepID=A0A1V4KUT6_PATFA|nr:myozenin-3 isoform B [Patagioenas fasciata monilis]